MTPATLFDRLFSIALFALLAWTATVNVFWRPKRKQAAGRWVNVSESGMVWREGES